jgi:hypothetical protein
VWLGFLFYSGALLGETNPARLAGVYALNIIMVGDHGQSYSWISFEMYAYE